MINNQSDKWILLKLEYFEGHFKVVFVSLICEVIAQDQSLFIKHNKNFVKKVRMKHFYMLV